MNVPQVLANAVTDSWLIEGLSPGSWLIFGVILVPVYAVFLGWFLGKPRDVKTAVMGLGYFVGLVFALWGGLFVKTVLIDLVFF